MKPVRLILRSCRDFYRDNGLMLAGSMSYFTMMAIVPLVIFRAALSPAPLLDLELADPKTWSGREALSKVTQRGWDGTDYNGLRLMAPKGLLNLAKETIDQLASPMQSLSPRYVRLSLRKTAPNLEVHLPFSDPRETDAQAYFQSLSNFGRAVSERT